MTGLPEELLRRIWQTRVTSVHHLTTATGLPLSVIDSGTPNENAGPDFLNALIRIGTRTFRGDVEVHGSPEAWYAHRHHTDPQYNRVVLHVVARCSRPQPPARTRSRRALPLLVLSRHFSDLHTLARQAPLMKHAGDDVTSMLARLSRSRSPHMLLRRRGWRRINGRVQRLERRVHQLLAEEQRILSEPPAYYEGHPDDIPFAPPAWTRREMGNESVWEQVLYEGVMEALGYSRNAGAFLGLARNVPLAVLRTVGRGDTDDVIALLFGAAGLIPSPRGMAERESRQYVRELRRRWRALQATLHVPQLHATDWLFFRLRPANFPSARLAVCAALLPGALAEGGFSMMRAEACTAGTSPRRRLRSLRRCFRCEPHTYWRHHLHFRGGTSRVGAALGRERIDAILTNSVLPLLIAYARSMDQPGLGHAGRAILNAMPSGHETRTLERVRKSLFPQGGKRLPAVEQQGVLSMLEENRRVRNRPKTRARHPHATRPDAAFRT